MDAKTSQPSIRRTQGLTLIEVLVAVFVLAIGLLGAASLQLVGSRGNNSAYLRSQATILANDLAERMHVNIAAVNNNAFAGIAAGSIDCSNAPNPYCSQHYGGSSNPVVAAGACGTGQIAASDLFEISCGVISGTNREGGVDDLLPAGTLSVVCADNDTTDADACTDGSNHTVSVGWSDRDTQGATNTRTVNITFRP
jgi:type IV pilus assembly protein PilV